MDPKIYIVGGAVRDLLLGAKPKDIDYVVVGATSRWMLDRGYKQVGADFPVFLDDRGNEWALARTERKSGRGYLGFETTFDPNVTIEDDLARRDLTINAMAMPYRLGIPDASFPLSLIVDPFNGQADLKAGILRHTSDAFADDPLRVLRLARFAARYDFTVAPETLQLAKRIIESGELDELPKERIWVELEKGLAERCAFKLLDVLYDVGALNVEPLKLYFGPDSRLSRGLLKLNGEMDPNITLILGLHSLAHVNAEEALRLRVPTTVYRMINHFQALNDALLSITRLTPESALALITRIKDLNDSQVASALKASAVYANLTHFTWIWERNLAFVTTAITALKALDYKVIVESGNKATIKERVKTAKLAAIQRCSVTYP